MLTKFEKERGSVCPRQPTAYGLIALKAAGIEDFRFHDIRHATATRLIMAGVDIQTVASLMGHKTLQMTMRYAHLELQHLADAVGRLVNFETALKMTSPWLLTRKLLMGR